MLSLVGRVTVASLLLVVAVRAYGEILRVPNDWPTIQAAFDAAQPEDEVLVAPGIFQEALYAPPFFIKLTGDTVLSGDSLATPLLDPAGLPGCDSLACLSVPQGGSMDISYFAFRNGAAMYPRESDAIGGILYETSERLSLDYCRFDSVFLGVWPRSSQVWASVDLESCHFVNMTAGCSMSRRRSTVRNCIVEGVSSGVIAVRDSSVVEYCQFSGVANAWLFSFGGNNVLRNNVLGPGRVGVALDVYSRTGGDTVRNNIFADIEDSGQIASIAVSSGSPAVFMENEVTRNSVDRVQSTAIGIDDDGNADASARVILTGNRIHHTRGIREGETLGVKGVYSVCEVCSVEIRRNIFEWISPPEGVVALVMDSAQHHVLTENIFQGNGNAVENNDFEYLMAELNYWGDSTGPYHPIWNNAGLGDTVSDRVDFIPWYTDTLFWNSTSPEPRAPLPSEVTLWVRPNPFNAVTTLELYVPHPQIVEM
ncbi:right-handed parallel beta-helix repeat-containing protein, partial [bacterium]|nr:right-handed parallel beta-helix repeat-containing protein [bacterium]